LPQYPEPVTESLLLSQRRPPLMPVAVTLSSLAGFLVF
jgi:hypothetical protein